MRPETSNNKKQHNQQCNTTVLVEFHGWPQSVLVNGGTGQAQKLKTFRWKYTSEPAVKEKGKNE